MHALDLELFSDWLTLTWWWVWLTGETEQTLVLCSLHGGGERRNGSNVKKRSEYVCVCLWGAAAIIPSAASAVMDLPLKLTSAVWHSQDRLMGITSQVRYLLDLSILFSYSDQPCRHCRPTPETCGWLMKKSMSDEQPCERVAPRFRAIWVHNIVLFLQWNVTLLYSTV